MRREVLYNMRRRWFSLTVIVVMIFMPMGLLRGIEDLILGTWHKILKRTAAAEKETG